MFFIQRSLISFVLVVFSISVIGQGTGLVLSGGGAKGLAHIGVIEALEENSIEIDYVSGTSMGAIVGALYVMGYTPGEMRALLSSEEFRRWSTGEVDPKLRFTYKRGDKDASMFTIGLKTEEDRTRPSIPTHIIPSEVIDFAILELTCGSNSVSGNNFDNLMVPFRCIAADVYNKREIVFRNGNLGQVVRASMAYPLYFEPVTIDSVLLFDGGIYNNFPFEVLLEDFNADFIIGSKVVNRSKRPDKDDLMLQLENMIMQKTNFTIPDSVGIVIETTFMDVDLLDLEKADSIILKGYNNTLKEIDKIIPYVKRIDSVRLSEKREKFKREMPDTIFSKINITGVNERQKSYISNLISKEEATFDIEQLKTEYFRLVSEENISRIYPEAVYNSENGTYDLNLDVELKDSYTLSAGGLISLTTYNQFFIGFNYYSLSDIFNMFSANFYLGQYYSSFKLAHRISIPQKSKLLIDFSLVGNRWNYFTNVAPSLFDNPSPSYAVRNERLFSASAGTPTGNNSLFRTGLSFSWIDDEYYQSFSFSETEGPDNSEYFYATLKASFERSTLNRRQLASQGSELLGSISYNNGFEFYNEEIDDSLTDPERWTDQGGWFAFRLRNENYSRAGNRVVLGTLLDITLSNRQTGHNYTSTLINSYKFEPTLFSRQLFGRSLRANNYIGGGVMPIFEYRKGLQFRSGLYLFVPVRRIEETLSGVEYGNHFEHIGLSGELSVIFHSPVGPISAGINYFSNEKSRVYYFINFGYILFNRKGLE